MPQRRLILRYKRGDIEIEIEIAIEIDIQIEMEIAIEIEIELQALAQSVGRTYSKLCAETRAEFLVRLRRAVAWLNENEPHSRNVRMYLYKQADLFV